jgi:hypothetical protein
MSQAPYPYQPPQAVPPNAPVPYAVPVGQFAGVAGAQRPVGVTVLAVLGIIGGLILLLGGAVTLAGVVLAPAANPLLRDLTVFYASAVDGVLRLVAGGALLASCIGAFTLKPWARRWLIMGATLLALLTIGDIILTVGWVVPLLESQQNSYGRRELVTPDTLMTLGVIKWVLGLAYAAAVFVILNTKAVKAAFSNVLPQPAPAQAGSYPPPGYPPSAPGG